MPGLTDRVVRDGDAARRTVLLCLAAHPRPPGDELRTGTDRAAAAIFGREAVLEIADGRDDTVVVTLAGASSGPSRVDDPRAAQALEAGVTAELGALGHRLTGVAVASEDAAVSDATRLERAVANEVGGLCEEATGRAQVQADRHDVAEVLEKGAIRTLFQPIADATTGRIVGYEALSRGPAGHPLEHPDRLLAVAERTGLGDHVEWEMRWLGSVRAAERIQGPDLLLFLNASPARLSLDTSPVPRRWGGSLPWPWDRVVVEITERAPVRDVSAFGRGRDELRSRGALFALDDAGAGYAGLTTLALLAPEYVKVDMALVRDCDRDPIRRAVIEALVHYVRRTGGLLIAEGIENRAELAAIRGLGVDLVQGFLLGAPAETPPQVDIRCFGGGDGGPS